jgi:hypothetical protein
MTLKLRSAFTGLALLAAGCTQAVKPDDQLATSEASVRTAQELGAQSIPPAALELQLAMDSLGHAKDLIKAGDNEGAKYQLWRSKADADLALALTRNSRAVAEADGAQAQLEDVKRLPPPQ